MDIFVLFIFSLLIVNSLSEVCFEQCSKEADKDGNKICETGCHIYQVLSYKNKLTEANKLTICENNCNFGYSAFSKIASQCNRGCKVGYEIFSKKTLQSAVLSSRSIHIQHYFSWLYISNGNEEVFKFVKFSPNIVQPNIEFKEIKHSISSQFGWKYCLYYYAIRLMFILLFLLTVIMIFNILFKYPKKNATKKSTDDESIKVKIISEKISYDEDAGPLPIKSKI